MAKADPLRRWSRGRVLLGVAAAAAPRPIVTELASGVLVMLGIYWFVLRSL